MPDDEPSPVSAPSVAAIVLAAGRSSRMGGNKLLASVGGQSLLRRAASRALRAGLDPVIVVLGHEAERAAAEIEELDCMAVVNNAYREGIGSSLKAGIAAVPSSAAAAVSMLADMPHVTTAMLTGLVDCYRVSGAPLVVSDYDGVTAPPFLYDRSLFPQIDEIPGHCDKRVIKRNRDRAVKVAWPASALEDVDEPADLDRAERRLAGTAEV